MLQVRALCTLLAFTFFLFLLPGCGPAAAPTAISPTAAPTQVPPTAMPTAIPLTATPTVATAGQIKTGHWEGKQPTVSFDVNDNRTIQNLTLRVPFDVNNTCTVEAKETQLQADNSFVISEPSNLTDAMKSLIELGARGGIPTPIVTPANSGDMIEGKHVEGRFTSPTSLEGTYLIVTCSNRFALTSGGSSKWTAQWSGK